MADKVADFNRQAEAEFRKIVTEGIPAGVKEVVLELRDRAERNRSTRLSKSGREKFRVGPEVQKFKRGQGVGGRGVSEADIARWRLGDPLFVYSTEFYDYMHEKGYYSKTGGARPKWMLRDALAAVDDLEVEI